MISQHLQTATLALEVSRQQSTEGIKFHVIAELQDFIALHPDVREVRKALAVKLVYQGYLYDEIQTILDVSRGSITGWKQTYEEYGISGLRLNHTREKELPECRTARRGVELVANSRTVGSLENWSTNWPLSIMWFMSQNKVTTICLMQHLSVGKKLQS